MFCGYEMAYWFSKFLLLKRWLSLNAFIKYFFLALSCFHLLHGYRCGLNVLFPTDLFSGLHLRNTGFVRKLPNSRLLLYVCVEQQCSRNARFRYSCINCHSLFSVVPIIMCYNSSSLPRASLILIESSTLGEEEVVFIGYVLCSVSTAFFSEYHSAAALYVQPSLLGFYY